MHLNSNIVVIMLALKVGAPRSWYSQMLALPCDGTMDPLGPNYEPFRIW